jgi:uncharacterized protein YcbK (DUF882 family)
MPFPPNVVLRHFVPSEFDHPERMEPELLRWLDDVRERAGIPFFLTDDYRTVEENQKLLDRGASPNSLHLRGRAVDFIVKPFNEYSLFLVAQAVMQLLDGIPAGVAVELELVYSKRDKHIHIAWTEPGALRAHRLLVRAD